MSHKNKISVYGASGHAKVVIDCLQTSGHELAYLFDDNEDTKELQDILVTSITNEKLQQYPILLGIGSNAIRKKLAEKIKANFSDAITHASAIISSSCKIGKGTVVMAGAVINADTLIGKHAIINTGAIVEHDCKLDDYVHISPNAALAGAVTVGEGTQVGIGAQVIQGIKIGKWCTIGAGAVVIKDVPDGATVVGNPGKVIKVNPTS